MVKDEFSLFKGHALWFAQRTTQPLKDAHPGNLEAFWAARRNWTPGPSALPWKCMGPFNVAGRVTTLIAHPDDAGHLYAGAAAGGVWRSTDGGLNWESCWPQWFNPNIGALAFHPTDPKTVYCATGEGNISVDSYSGSGIYVTHDAGDHWDVLADAAAAAIPRRIGAFYPDPHKPGRILLGGVNHVLTDPAGLYCSEDSGITWHRENFFSKNYYWCHSVLTHPDGSIYAALHLNGAQTGVWRQDSSGWRRLGKGMPTGDRMSRISLAMAPSDPNVLYALVAERHGKLILDAFRSSDRGESWHSIGGSEFVNDNKQSIYNNCIAVHPQHPEIVVCGVQDVHLSRDSGATWTRASQWDAGEGAPAYAHADHHTVLLPGGNLLYTASDGGVFSSEDLGGHWSPRPHRMCNTMFYDIDVAPTDGALMCGGSQDNGTLLTAPGANPGDWTRVLFGDGAWTAFDPTDAGHVFASTSNIQIYRHSAAQHWGTDTWLRKTPKELKPEEHSEVAIAVMAVDPEHPNTLWFGTRRLWRTTDNAETWAPVTPPFDGSPVTAIEIPPAAPEQIWVGTRSGGIFRSLDRGATWTCDLSGPEIPELVISRIETHPRSARRLVVTVAGTGLAPRMKSVSMAGSAYGLSMAENDSLQHVFYSDDAGFSWRSIQSPEMPDVAYHAAVFETHEPYRLFVSNDCGVWMTEDLAKWSDVSGNLPTVMVDDLVYHHHDRALIAATHGRGIWRAEVLASATISKS